MKASEKVYWTKAALGPITGLICFYVQTSLDIHGQIALMLGTTLYIAFSEAAAMIFKVDRNRTIKIALGAFLFTWIFTWTLLNTLSYFAWV